MLLREPAVHLYIVQCACIAVFPRPSNSPRILFCLSSKMSARLKPYKNQNLMFLRKLLSLYQELIQHDGYGELHISIRRKNSKQKQVKLQCGREYIFDIHSTNFHPANRYKIVDYAPNSYCGPERRNLQNRRQTTSRRLNNEPRHFRLERRIHGERRSGHGRRHDD